MQDEELLQRIRERAFELWEGDDRPEGREMEYWLRAEQELAPLSVAGEEDPLEALDHTPRRRRGGRGREAGSQGASGTARPRPAEGDPGAAGAKAAARTERTGRKAAPTCAASRSSAPGC